MKEVFQDNLINAVEMADLNPNTFQIPSDEDIEALKAGDHVKICNGYERFWVKITKVKGTDLNAAHIKFIGQVDNMLVGKQPYNLNDLIVFYGYNIYQIL